MSDERVEEPNPAAGRGDEDLIGLVAQLRGIVARQQRAIDDLRSENEGLRRGRPFAPPATPPRPSAADQAAASPGGPGKAAAPVSGADFTIIFDGGSLGNPGRGYGSYQIVGQSGVVAHRRLDYGDRVTNNQSEYRTLIHALEDLRDRIGGEASGTNVAVRGDSKLVVEQVSGRWKVNHPELRPLRAKVQELLGGFARADVAWHRRDASVRVLGH